MNIDKIQLDNINYFVSILQNLNPISRHEYLRKKAEFNNCNDKTLQFHLDANPDEIVYVHERGGIHLLPDYLNDWRETGGIIERNKIELVYNKMQWVSGSFICDNPLEAVLKNYIFQNIDTVLNYKFDIKTLQQHKLCYE